MKFTFKAGYGQQYTGVISRTRYQDGSLCMRLIDPETGEVIANITCALDTPPPFGHIYVKDWSENVGMMRSLMDAGIVEQKVAGYVPSGYVMVPVCKLVESKM